MTGSRLSARDVLRREWLVVLVAALVGLGLAFAMSRQAPSTTWQARYEVDVYPPAGGPSNPPSAKDLVGAASQSDVQAAVEETLGLEPGSLQGKVAVKLEGEDKRTVVFTATGADEQQAAAIVRASADAAHDKVLGRFEQYVAELDDIIATQVVRSEEASERAAQLEKTAASLSPADRAGYEQALVALRNVYYTSVDEAKDAQVSRSQIVNFALFREVTTKQQSLGGLQLSSLLQGLFLGLIVGVIVAAIREWLLLRPRAGE